MFKLKGIVQHGKKRGKNLGFPTANFTIDPNTPRGIFISQTTYQNKTYQSITFIGTADTFDEKDFVAETYILNFDQDIYRQEIEVNILKKLRDSKKFDSEQELITQMKKDEEQVEKFFREHIQ